MNTIAISNITEELGLNKITADAQSAMNDRDIFNGPVDVADKGLGDLHRRMAKFANSALGGASVALDQVDAFVANIKEALVNGRDAVQEVDKYGVNAVSAGASLTTNADATPTMADMLDKTTCNMVTRHLGMTMDEGAKHFESCRNATKSL